MSYSKRDIILLRYPFSDFSGVKVRPAVCISSIGEKYQDIFIAPLTSRIQNLSEGEYVLSSWNEAGLNVPTAVKRGCYLIDINLIRTKIGVLTKEDSNRLDTAIKKWLELWKYFLSEKANADGDNSFSNLSDVEKSKIQNYYRDLERSGFREEIK